MSLRASWRSLEPEERAIVVAIAIILGIAWSMVVIGTVAGYKNCGKMFHRARTSLDSTQVSRGCGLYVFFN